MAIGLLCYPKWVCGPSLRKVGQGVHELLIGNKKTTDRPTELGHNYVFFTNTTGMGGKCEIGMNGDKIPYFWIYQFLGDDMKATIVAESEDKNTVCKTI